MSRLLPSLGMPMLAAAALLLAAAPLPAADDLTVLGPGPDGSPPARLLHTYLLTECQKAFDARRAAVAALKTPDDVRRRQQELRTKFVAALGGFPDKTPLKPRVLGTLTRNGYRLERVAYESRPGHHVTAVLYLPDSTKPVPGILVPCGHSANGKAAEAYQRACILLAKHGFAVLCYDPIGQGERVQLLDAMGKPAIAGSTSEHTMVGVGALLVGKSTATYRIWDGIRSLDYLASRPEVDPKRLGCTGNSGGGTLTAYLMALDDRIVAAAPSCYITSLERLFATIGPQDAEQNIPGQVAFGLEHVDYVTLRAPRPTLVCTGTQDFFDIQGAWTTFREAKLQYGLLGHAERVDLFEYNDKHGFSKPRREAALRWMRRWLQGIDDAPTEGDFPICTDAEMQVTRTGQVLEDWKGASAFHLNAAEAAALAARRSERSEPRDPAALRRDVATLIGHRIPRPEGPAAEIVTLRREGFSIEKSALETEPGVRVPWLLYRPAREEKSLIVYVDGDGKAAAAGPGGRLEAWVQEGHPVLALDLRGFGETAPGKAAAGRSNHFGVDSREAFLALHLARPLLGQRTSDLVTALERLGQRAKLGLKDVHVVGVGSAAPVVLHAAALQPRIARVTLERGLATWESVASTPVSSNQLTNVVPGALRLYDFPDLAELLTPRPLTVSGATDGQGKALPLAAAQRAYAGARGAYERAGAGKELVVR